MHCLQTTRPHIAEAPHPHATAALPPNLLMSARFATRTPVGKVPGGFVEGAERPARAAERGVAPYEKRDDGHIASSSAAACASGPSCGKKVRQRAGVGQICGWMAVNGGGVPWRLGLISAKPRSNDGCCISAVARPQLGCLSAASRLPLGCLSAASRLPLGCLSAASRLQPQLS